MYEQTGAKEAKQKVDHLAEDAREAWDTSQNPWVYRVSSVYETITAETPESIAVAELRKLDPLFTLDDWRRDVVEYTLPKIMEWLLLGKINQLKPWLNESTFQRIAAEITARKQEGVQIDTHVLGIMNSEILAVEPDEVNKGSPIIVLHFMCQQINCVRKKKDGTVGKNFIFVFVFIATFFKNNNTKRSNIVSLLYFIRHLFQSKGQKMILRQIRTLQLFNENMMKKRGNLIGKLLILGSMGR